MMMSSESMVSFLRKVAPGVEQFLQQNETVDIFQVILGLLRLQRCTAVVVTVTCHGEYRKYTPRVMLRW